MAEGGGGTQFLCADAAPCRDILLEDIDVQPARRREGWDSYVHQTTVERERERERERE